MIISLYSNLCTRYTLRVLNLKLKDFYKVRKKAEGLLASPLRKDVPKCVCEFEEIRFPFRFSHMYSFFHRKYLSCCCMRYSV